MERNLLLYFILTQWFRTIFGQENITFPILNVTDVKINETAMLRYGHQRTGPCQEFVKAYICIMRCLELGFDIAHSNKDCICTCTKDEVKAKYFDRPRGPWTIPTTRRPAWAFNEPIRGKIIGGELVLSESKGKTPTNGSDVLQETTTLTSNDTEGVQDTTLDPSIGNTNGEDEQSNADGEEPPANEGEAPEAEEEKPADEEK